MSDQFEFVPSEPIYPKVPGFAKKRVTSRKAAETVSNPTGNRRIVYDALVGRAMTDYEICAHLGGDWPMNRVQPRRSELSADGVVIDSGVTRLTPYGKQAIVWKIGRKFPA